ncbi:hypothetical protein [Streptomyces filamentosus]|uniref:Uncharacterized protein n=1 Tax=Streptomyces filamentosus TaxID=67294 RepID=A0A919B9R6_STRFL|nr:hypothetical protein GCM10017667_01000 [Streptomyces filamentosus]
MHFKVFTETFDANVRCRFLARLADHVDEIELHFLPSYSAELKPGELVNADLKRSLPPHTESGTSPNSPPRLEAPHVRYVLDE